MGSSLLPADPFTAVATQDIFLEFRAGKMIMEGKRVVADSRKGLFRLIRGEEGLVHFQWLDRATNVVEDDLIIFPEEATFEKVTQAPGRIYILKFNTDDRKFFFWMQEPKADNDSQLCDSVNFHIIRPLGFGLADIFKADLLFPLLETLPLEERLASYLPEGQWNLGELIDLIQSPPFRQQVDSFTYVLRTGQVDLTQFGIDPNKYKFTVTSFLEALEDSVLKSDELTQGEQVSRLDDQIHSFWMI